MAWFTRKNSASDAPDTEGHGPRSSAAEAEVDEFGRPSTPVAPIEGDDRERIRECLNELAGSGVDVDDLASLSQGLEAAYRSWSQDRDQDHSTIVRRYAIGIGEHLSRHTDLDWAVVTDVFGTDLGLAEGPRGAFVVVPGNIVASRWLRGETQWIPAVVGHLVRRRER